MLRRATFLGALAALVATVVTASPSVEVNMTDLALKTSHLKAWASTTQAETTHVQYSIRNGQVKSRGVNLGGWLVAENWMSTEADFWQGLSEDVKLSGEYAAITNAANWDTVHAQFEKHHATFITEADIKAIAEAGLNTVRVPVGYWIVGFDNNDPSGKAEWSAFTKGTLKYLDVLIWDWAKKYNIAVLVDIHAAKGSQNGNDHSSPTVRGKSYWGEYSENVENTLTMVKFLAERYRYEPAFLGIGLLNEPALTTNEDVLYKYYEGAYKAIRATGNDCVLGVAPLLYKQDPDTMVGFMQAPQYKNVWVEWHPYFKWGYEQTSEYDLINISVKKEYQAKVTKWQSRANHNRLFIGEWSFGTANKFLNNKNQFYEFAEAQAKVLNQADAGWTFWSWRVSDDSVYNDWSLRSVLRDPKLKGFLLG